MQEQFLGPLQALEERKGLMTSQQGPHLAAISDCRAGSPVCSPRHREIDVKKGFFILKNF